MSVLNFTFSEDLMLALVKPKHTEYYRAAIVVAIVCTQDFIRNG